jgi:hypothetical protein
MRKFFRRLYALFHRRRLQRELEEEMAGLGGRMPGFRQARSEVTPAANWRARREKRLTAALGYCTFNHIR